MASLFDVTDVFDNITENLNIEDLFALHCVNKRLYDMVNAVYRVRLERFIQTPHHFYVMETKETKESVDRRLVEILNRIDEVLPYILMPISVIEQGLSYSTWIIQNENDINRIPLNIKHILVESAFLYGGADQFEYMLKKNMPVSVRRLWEYSDQYNACSNTFKNWGDKARMVRKFKIFLPYISAEKIKIEKMIEGLIELQIGDIEQFARGAYEFSSSLAILPKIQFRQENRLMVNQMKLKIRQLEEYTVSLRHMIIDMENDRFTLEIRR